jgi:hypothetical protein
MKNILPANWNQNLIAGRMKNNLPAIFDSVDGIKLDNKILPQPGRRKRGFPY